MCDRPDWEIEFLAGTQYTFVIPVAHLRDLVEGKPLSQVFVSFGVTTPFELREVVHVQLRTLAAEAEERNIDGLRVAASISEFYADRIIDNALTKEVSAG